MEPNPRKYLKEDICDFEMNEDPMGSMKRNITDYLSSDDLMTEKNPFLYSSSILNTHTKVPLNKKPYSQNMLLEIEKIEVPLNTEEQLDNVEKKTFREFKNSFKVKSKT